MKNLLLFGLMLMSAGLWAQNQNLGNVTTNNLQVNGKAAMPAPKLSDVTGAAQCLHADATGQVSGTGVDCGTGGTGGNVTGGTLTNNALSLGSGGSAIKVDPALMSNGAGTLTGVNFIGAHNGTVGATTPNTGVFTNLTATNFAANVNGVINAKAFPYNAKGDGTTNDTAALQTALNAAVNGKLILPPGKYLISSALNFCGANRVTLEGTGSPMASQGSSGVNQTAIYQSTANLPVIDTCTATDWRVAHLWLAHSVTPTSGGDGLLACQTQLCAFPVVDDVYTGGDWNGFNLGPATGGNISHSWASNNKNDGVLMIGKSFSNGLQWGVQVVNSENNDGWGIHAVMSGTAATGGTLSPWVQSYTYGNTAGGVFLSAPNNGHHLSDISIMNHYGSTDGNDEIRVDTYGANVTIVGAVLENAGTDLTGSAHTTPASHQGSGINITANNTDVILSANTIQFMSNNGITDAGYGTVVVGNRLSSSAVSGYVGVAPAANSTVVGNSMGNNVSYGAFLGSANAACTAGNTYYGNGTPVQGTPRMCQDSGNLFASPPPIGNTAPNTGTYSTLTTARLTTTGGISQSSGFKHERFASCTTTAGANGFCSTSHSWAAAFPDLSYSVVCSQDVVITGNNILVNITFKTPAAVTYTAQIGPSGVAASQAYIDCIAIHD